MNGDFRPWHTDGGNEVRSVDGTPVVVVLEAATRVTGADGRPAGSAPGERVADQVAALLDGLPDVRLVVCDVTALVRPGPADLHQLGRLRLVTRRRGCGLVLRNAGLRLRLLLELTGLDEVFVCEGAPAGGTDHGLAGAVNATDLGP